MSHGHPTARAWWRACIACSVLCAGGCLAPPGPDDAPWPPRLEPAPPPPEVSERPEETAAQRVGAAEAVLEERPYY